jgi:hypothetical protein
LLSARFECPSASFGFGKGEGEKYHTIHDGAFQRRRMGYAVSDFSEIEWRGDMH